MTAENLMTMNLPVRWRGGTDMTREECEKLLMDTLSIAWGIYKQYNPNGEYLMMSASDTEERMFMYINNKYYDEDADHPIDKHYLEEKENG